jgi:hypothetical protein
MAPAAPELPDSARSSPHAAAAHAKNAKDEARASGRKASTVLEGYQVLASFPGPRFKAVEVGYNCGSWRLAKCPDTRTLRYHFQTGANVWWTSLWVRNPRVPVTKVEVKSDNHASFIELDRGGDGTLTDAGGFGEGSFTFRVTGIDGQVIEDQLAGFEPGQIVTSTKQFR